MLAALGYLVFFVNLARFLSSSIYRILTKSYALATIILTPHTNVALRRVVEERAIVKNYHQIPVKYSRRMKVASGKIIMIKKMDAFFYNVVLDGCI